MEVRLPQYPHRPMRIIGFDDQEFVLVALCYVLSLILKGSSFLYLLIALFVFIPYKRSKPRGFIGHLFYRAGFGRFKGYPPYFAEVFHE